MFLKSKAQILRYVIIKRCPKLEYLQRNPQCHLEVIVHYFKFYFNTKFLTYKFITFIGNNIFLD